MIKPILDYILVEPSKKELTTESGIALPDNAKEKPCEGKVIAVGPGQRETNTTVSSGATAKMSVRIGDTILYKKWGGHEVKHEGKDYLLIQEHEVLAVIEN